MFKKILVPTDGSKLSRDAAGAAVRLARDLGAEIVVFVATPEFRMRVIEDAAFAPGTLSEVDFNKAVKRSTKTYLSDINLLAEAKGVTFTGAFATNENPAQAIVDAALQYQCDLIFMGSHGRSNLVQLFLGGVTTKVLSLSSIPVMVFREPKAKETKGALRRAK